MTSSTVLSLSSLLVSVLALLVSGGVAVRQLARMRHSNLLPVALDMFREFRAPEFREHMGYLQDELWDECPPGTCGVADLPPGAKAHLATVSGYFNNMGVLVANGVVDAQLVQSFMGGSIITAWWRISPYIRAERRRRGDDPNYALFFEHLAAHCIKTSPAELHRRLHLDQVPADWTLESAPVPGPTPVAKSPAVPPRPGA